MLKDTVIKYLKPFGVSGFETAAEARIEADLAPFADEIRKDALGNLILIKHGQGKRIMLSAHMDQIGFIVINITPEGFLRVSNVGGVRAAQSVNRVVEFENGLRGVITSTAKAPAETTMRDLMVDIGVHTKEEAEKLVSIGDPIRFAETFVDMGDKLSSAYMDNRSSCALLAEVFKALKDCPNEVYAVFSVQEEVGCRGAQTAAFALSPDLGIAIDVTPTDDIPGGGQMPVKLGEGIAIKVMDRSVIAHPQVRKWMEEAAVKAGVPFQNEIITAGGTDAGAIHLSGAGVRSGVLSIPCRYVHSQVETVSLKDMEGGVKLLLTLLSEKL